ncbi:MAG: GNAT family N-acetyltransferase [Alphaproteobacteria bacterium]|nr:GNAT family N-acetyltransferase [Alphaproteobacteria bacterium]
MRIHVMEADVAAVRTLTAATGFFRPDEVDIAVELVEDGLSKGNTSDYRFFFEDGEDGLVAYACYGRVPCTVASWDLYWIAVDPLLQGQGIGRRLVEAVEADVRRCGGAGIYVDTAGRPDYAPTRGFYMACGYSEAARFPDFYAPDDAKVVYAKRFV